MFSRIEDSSRNWFPRIDRARVCIAFALIAFTAMPGCNVFNARNQLKELETENNRLLSEFRAERQRRETAEQTAQQLEARLAESEKLLARQSQEQVPGRLSSMQGLSNLNGLSVRPEFQVPLYEQSPGNGLQGQSNFLQTPSTSSDQFRWQRRSK